MSPPIPIPPLIPLPNDPSTNGREGQDDLFATLFSPPTPRASPIPSPSPERGQARPNIHHRKSSSVDSDFGAFVSVPAADDPLAQSADEISPMSPFFDRNVSGASAGDARAPADGQSLGVLDETLHHQDDPLYWIQSSTNKDSSRTVTPRPPQAEPPIINDRASVAPIDFLSDERPMSDLSTSDLNDGDDSSFTTASEDLHRSSQQHEPSVSPLRSPSLPPMAPHISQPEVQRSQSFFVPSSIPSRWVPSFLASASRSSFSSLSPKDKDRSRSRSPVAAASLAPKRQEATLPAVLPSQIRDALHATESASHSRAQTISSPPSLDAVISHGTPFSSHPYVPPSGAPGFAGDRTWDKGFEFDQAGVEKKTVKLLGRKELTTPVLTSELADLLRPQFPALARLPRSWNLLYSLDQHGISLNTLYTRCDSHTGSALIVVRDAGDAIFGAWMGEGVHPHKGGYYGSGESFLWRQTADGGLRIYKWTGKNDYIALCERDYISFGGGDGHYGLYLDAALADGSSASCPTFNNEPLCSPGPRQGQSVTFECVALEVWGIG